LIKTLKTPIFIGIKFKRMAQKEIKLLQQQIDKLYEKDFELQPWKNYTIILLERIFGPENEKIKMIRKVEFEFSSWSLRDASGNESYEEGSKKLAREILQAAIDELKAFGIPDLSKNVHSDQAISDFLSCLLDELKGSQVKELKAILTSRENLDEKKRKIKDILQNLGEYGVYDVITNMLTKTEAQTIILKM
jgi:hypothetical protein